MEAQRQQGSYPFCPLLYPQGLEKCLVQRSRINIFLNNPFVSVCRHVGMVEAGGKHNEPNMVVIFHMIQLTYEDRCRNILL